MGKTGDLLVVYDGISNPCGNLRQGGRHRMCLTCLGYWLDGCPRAMLEDRNDARDGCPTPL